MQESSKQSYTAFSSKLRFLADSALQLGVLVRRGALQQAAMEARVQGYHSLRQTIEEELGGTLEGKRVLEVGHGQMPLVCAYFASLPSEVTGIDLDRASQGLSPSAYWSILRSGGLRRVMKTAARECLGINRTQRKALCRVLGLARFPKLDLRQMDACQRLEFVDGEFDVALSVDVFEHLPDPRTTLRELGRVIKPGGVVLLRFVHYAWFNALHDLRLLNIESAPTPLWPHLRAQYRHLVQQGAYVNDLRLDDWRSLVQETLPSARVTTSQLTHPRALREFQELRRGHECPDYSDEELLTDRITVLWKRPA